MEFVHQTLPQRVRFAPGQAAAGVAAEVAGLDGRRVMLIASDREAADAARIAADVPVVVTHHEVAMHVPVPVAERAREVARRHRADVLLTIGGGSATGLGKAVALTSGLPVIAVPTTYAGSEATDVWGTTEDGTKTTGVDARVLPRSVVYDAGLTLSLPVDLTVASTLNALAHSVDALWAPRADPINAALAIEGARGLVSALPAVVDEPEAMPGREGLLYGAYLAAVAFTSAGSGLHHKICHVLGGRFDLPHAPTHAVVLPHVLALNAPFAPDAERRLADVFDADTAVAGLEALRRRVRAPGALRDLGLRESDIPDAAEAILPVVPASNPAPVGRDELERLLHDAWEGTDPR